MKYIYYKTDGTHELIESEAPLSLKRLQALVGGSIEFTHQEPDSTVLCCNEEGLMNEMPENPFFVYINQGVEGFMRGNIIQGLDRETPDDMQFIGFDDPTPHIRTKIHQ